MLRSAFRLCCFVHVYRAAANKQRFVWLKHAKGLHVQNSAVNLFALTTTVAVQEPRENVVSCVGFRAGPFPTLNLLNNISYLPLLVLTGIYHHWTGPLGR